MQKNFGQRQIPTLLGIAVLVLALVAGVALIGTGGGVFAPRAAPQTTPKNVKITNVRDTSFTVSFLTDESTVGFVKYGTQPSDLKLQASDDRDQLSGNVGQFTSHYITVRDLQPDTTYTFALGTGTGATYLNEGQPYQVKTFKKLGNPPTAKTVYGNVVTTGSTPANGAIVYLSITGLTPLSSLVKDSGSWAIPLSTARTADGTKYATINPSDTLQIMVQGISVNSVTNTSTTFAEAQPVKTLSLAGGVTTGNSPRPSASPTSTFTSPSPSSVVYTSPSPSVRVSPSPSSSSSALIATQNPNDTETGPTSTVVTMNAKTAQVVDTTQPTIVGQAAPNVTVKIVIHSTTAITTSVKSDTAGKYVVDLEALKKELAPGEHTVTITYTDPQTGKTVTEEQTFTVEDTSSQNLLAMASTSPKPFGTSNPYSLDESPSPSATSSSRRRVSTPATTSAIPRSGSTSTTIALIGLGGLFLLAGAWSIWNSRRSLATAEDEFDLDNESPWGNE